MPIPLGVLAVAGAGGGIVLPNQAIAAGSKLSPYVHAWAWDSSTGFGSKFSDPATLPSGRSYGCKFSPDGKYVGFANINSPYIFVYPWTNSGFGTKFANPSLPPAEARGIGWSRNSNVVIAGHAGAGTNSLSAYPVSASGFGTEYADASGQGGTGHGTGFTTNDADVVASFSDGTPYLAAWPWTPGFGTIYTAPSPAPSVTSGGQVSINKNTNDVGVAWAGNDRGKVWAFSSGVGWGTAYAAPATLPNNPTQGVAFNQAGTEIVFSGSDAPNSVAAYPWSGGIGTKYSAPTSEPSSVYQVSFSRNGDAVTVGTDETLYGGDPLATWAFTSGSGFGSKYSAPASVPATVYEPSFI